MRFALEHIGLAARDPAALKEWYVATLGARVLLEIIQSPAAFLLEFPGNVRLEIYQGDSSVRETGLNSVCGWRHLALEVESIESARDDLVEMGVKFEEPIKPAGGGGRVLFFKDIDGNLLHLVERPKDWPSP